MRKPGANYKMSKPHKMWAASILDPHKRGEWKRMMINAELYAAETAKQTEKGSKNKSED